MAEIKDELLGEDGAPTCRAKADARTPVDAEAQAKARVKAHAETKAHQALVKLHSGRPRMQRTRARRPWPNQAMQLAPNAHRAGGARPQLGQPQVLLGSCGGRPHGQMRQQNWCVFCVPIASGNLDIYQVIPSDVLVSTMRAMQATARQASCGKTTDGRHGLATHQHPN